MRKSFDRYLKRLAREEGTYVPDSAKNRIEEVLAALPEGRACRRPYRALLRIGTAAACILLVTLFLLPNMSKTYAHALEQVPIIGELVQVVTIRNYFYLDETHEMDIEVPRIENGIGNQEEFDRINGEVEELTQTLVDRFYQDLEAIGPEGHSAVYVDYEIITDTGRWFTLKLLVHEAAGSSNTYYKYYHLDKWTGETVTLGDLAADEAFYQVVEQELREQMTEAEKKDEALHYWVEDDVFGDRLSVEADHNFYWNEKGDLVIPFDKYEVAPGYMGTPEFVIDRETVTAYLKEEYRDLFSLP